MADSDQQEESAPKILALAADQRGLCWWDAWWCYCNAVAIDFYQFGFVEIMSPRHNLGGQVVLEKGEESRRAKLRMLKSPGLSRGGLPSQLKTRRSCAATPGALDLEESLPSSTFTGWGKGNFALCLTSQF